MQHVQREVGAKVRKLRKERGLTQDEFADRCGLHRAHMGEIERGESNITLRTLKTLADALGVKMHDVLGKL